MVVWLPLNAAEFSDIEGSWAALLSLKEQGNEKWFSLVFQKYGREIYFKVRIGFILV